ncbi:hypothetical protein QQZ08_001192 [Neonectria magnoliae]|uniref:Dynamin stalk domain-containing protein n=1 Tax=Neonectria magnoliae TaxID=2732573 RepID=A0ABR1IGW4_9HYPO
MAKEHDKDGKRTLGILTRLDAAERGPSQEIGLLWKEQMEGRMPTERALDGKYDNALFGSLGDNSLVSQQARLRANIREMNRLFGRVMLEAGRKFNMEQESDGDDSASRSEEVGENEPEQRSEGSGLRDTYSQGSQDELAPVLPSIDGDESLSPACVFPALDSEVLDSDVEVSSVLPKTAVFLFYTHKKPRLVTREDLEGSVLRFIARWRGTEGHGDTNTALTKEVYNVQTSPWEAIVGNHSQALWQAVEQFVTLALVETVDARVRRGLEKEIVKPGMKQLQKRFFAKRQEILEAHRNVDPSCYDGLINRPALTAQSNKLANRLGHWVGDNSELQDATDDRTYTNFPLAMERFSAARTVDLAEL